MLFHTAGKLLRAKDFFVKKDSLSARCMHPRGEIVGLGNGIRKLKSWVFSLRNTIFKYYVLTICMGWKVH
jgi:hypothetical protein